MIFGLRNVRMAGAVGIALTAGVALTACQGSSSGDSAAKDSGAPTSAAASAGGTTATTGPTDSASSTPAPPAKTTGGTSGAADSGAGTTTRCQTANLGFSFGPDSGAQSVGSPGGIDVVLANKGSGTCTLDGFPGVDIISKSGTHWSLTRQSKSYGKVTLKPGSAASFEITYLPFDSDNSGGSAAFHAASLLVTPPGETHSTSLKWDGFADVMDQSGATHPGTYVGPVVAGDGS